MKPKSTLRSFLVFAGSSMLAISSQAHAAGTFTWTGGAGINWSSAVNWGGTAPSATDDALVFAGTTDQTNTNDLLGSVLSLTLNNAGWNITLGTLTIGSGGIVANGTSALGGTLTLGAAQSWTNSTGLLTVTGTVANGGNLLTVGGTGNTAISSAIGGAGGLTKSGAGTLTLSGANGYTGATIIDAGTLLLNGTAGAIASSSAITVGNANGPVGVLTLDNATTGNANRVGSVAMGFNNGTLNFIGNASAASLETIGTITAAKGDNLINLSGGAVGQVAVLTSTAGAITRTAGATMTIVADGTNQQFKFTGGSAGINKGVFFGATAATANEFAYYPGSGGAVVAPTYGSGDFATAATTLTTLKHNKLSGTIATTGAVASLYSINMPSNYSITALTGSLTFSNAADRGAIIKSGGGAAQIGTAGNAFDIIGVNSGELVFNTVAAADDLTLNIGITATSTALTKTGAGTLTLTANRDYLYTGATTINAGTLVVNGLTATSAGGFKSNVTVNNGGTLKLGAANKIADAATITVNAGGILDMNNFADTVTTVTLNGGTINTASLLLTSALAVNGSGQVTGGGSLTSTALAMTGASFATGAGTYTLGGAFTGNASATTSIISGNLNLGGAQRTFTIWDGAAATDLDVQALVSNGGIIKSGNGLMQLAGGGINSYTGLTDVQGGTLAYGGSDVIANGGSIKVSGGILNISSFNDTVTGVQLTRGTISGTSGILTSTTAFDMQAGAVTAILGGSVGLTKTTAGTVILSGANTYNGGTTLTTGTLQFAKTAAMSATGAVAVGTDATLAVNAGAASGEFTNGNTAVNGSIGGLLAGLGGQSGGTVSYTGNVALGIDTTNAVSGTMTYSGVIGDVGTSLGITKLGTGTLVLDQTNTYTGATTVSAGTLVTTKAAALPGYNASGKVIFGGGTVGVQVGGAGWTTGEVDTLLTNATKTAGTLGIDTTNGNLTQWTAFITSNLGPALGLTKLGTGTLVLDQANTYAGLTTVSAGTLNLTNALALQNSALVTNGAGTVTVTGPTTLTLGGLSGATGNLASVITSGYSGLTNLTLNPQSGRVTYGGVIANGASGMTLTKTGAGTQVLSGANTYTGTTTVTAGTLDIASGSVAGPITLNGGTIALANYYSGSTLNVAANSTISVAGGFPSYLDGPLTGSANLTVSGFSGSLLYLANNGASNTFTGDITIDSGILRITASPFATTTGGFTAPSMTSSDTITINRAGTLYIDDNVGYTADRFGTGLSSNRPAVNLAGGRIDLNGLNNASSSVQTLGGLTASAGYSIITNTDTANGIPTLTFDSLSISKGAVINFYSATLGTGTNDARIKFTNTPTMINGIIAGAKVWNPATGGVGELATYDATNGVKVFTAYTVSNDINVGTSSTTNFQMTEGSTPAALTGNRAVNSLNYRAKGGTWSLGTNKLTLTSGMFLRNGTNEALTINNGTLTAGNGTNAIDLHIFTAQQNVTIDAVIADNASSVVSLVKSHGNLLTVSGGANNTYTGGTYVVDGSLTTGTTANRTYLGTGKVTVDGTSVLTLGNIGATSNAGSGANADYTAINGGQIAIASGTNGAYTANDTFNIGAGSVISGNSASGQGLASLDRGIDGGTANITLAEDAIIGHDYSLTTALNLTTGTIKNLGTNADLYYGFKGSTNQVSTTAVINIGTGTAFKGLALFGASGTFDGGTINVGSGTTDVYIKTNGANTAAPATLTFGYDYFAGAGATITLADAGTLNVNVLGNMNSRDTNVVYGDTSTGRNVVLVAKAGSNLQFLSAASMGMGTGVASARIENGGSLTMNTSANALNGAVTVQAGGRFDALLAGGVTGTGQLTFEAGSLINITHATGFSGAQASAASIAAGTIVRLNANSFGAADTTLDSVLGSGSNAPIFVIYGNNRAAAEPTAPNTSIMTLNKDINGVGGILTNYEIGNRGLSATTNGVVTLGANGGTIASTTNNSLLVAEDITGNGSLTIGTTAIIDGLTKLGTVQLGAANTYTGGTIVSAGTLQTNNALALGSTSGQLTVNTGGTLNMNTVSLTVGNLTGTGGTITGISGSRTLTIGQGDFGGGNYQGSIQNGGGTTALTKTGTGTITLSGANTYTGATSVQVGKLVVGVAGVGSITSNVTVSSSATLAGSGTITGNIVLNAESALNAKNGGKLAPGNSPGVLTATGTTTVNTGSVFAWTIDSDAVSAARGTEYAGLNTTSVGGTGAVFQIVTTDSQGFGDAFWTTNHDWTDIFKSADGSTSLTNDWSAMFTSFAYSDGTNPITNVGDYGSFTWTNTGNTLTWTAAVIPEPTSALAGLLLTAGLLRRRRTA